MNGVYIFLGKWYITHISFQFYIVVKTICLRLKFETYIFIGNLKIKIISSLSQILDSEIGVGIQKLLYICISFCLGKMDFLLYFSVAMSSFKQQILSQNSLLHRSVHYNWTNLNHFLNHYSHFSWFIWYTRTFDS